MADIGANYEMVFDPASVARIERLIAADIRMRVFFEAAMNYSVNAVLKRAQNNASSRFQDPTGNILQNLTDRVRSWDVGEVGVTASVGESGKSTALYARRREFGFTGRWDHRPAGSQTEWRYYQNDPGIFYLRDALVDSQAQIATAFQTSVTLSIRNIALP